MANAFWTSTGLNKQLSSAKVRCCGCCHGRQDKNARWNTMSKRQQPGRVASTNRNTTKIMYTMTHHVSVVSGLHSVYRFMPLSLGWYIIIDDDVVCNSLCLSGFLLSLCLDRTPILQLKELNLSQLLLRLPVLLQSIYRHESHKGILETTSATFNQ